MSTRLMSAHGAPAYLRSDSGPEFVSRAILQNKPMRTDRVPTVVLWWTSHGEGSVSPSASAKLGLQPLALPQASPSLRDADSKRVENLRYVF